MKQTNAKKRIWEVWSNIEHLSKEQIENVLSSNSNSISEYAYILHDKDVYNDEDEFNNPNHKAKTLKKAHWHIFIRFNYGIDAKAVAKLFNIGDNFVWEIQARFADALIYMTHKMQPEKFQYSDDEVISNFDWKLERDARYEQRKKKDENELDSSFGKKLNNILKAIDKGEITEYNLHSNLSTSEFVKYDSIIKKAFTHIRELKLEKNKGGRNMKVIYIQGKPGSGKTTYAKMLAEQDNLSYFISSSSNDPLDGYKGQDCIIMDDMRATMHISDLLKLLDNNTQSTFQSRYYNKIIIAKLLIITTVLPIDVLYEELQNNNEPINQLKRRCNIYIAMDKEKLKIFQYNRESEDYQQKCTAKNPVWNYLKVKKNINFDEDDNMQLDFVKKLEVIKDDKNDK